MVTWLFYNFAVCRDAARRAGSSATVELLFREDAVGGRARVTTDEERVLRGRW